MNNVQPIIDVTPIDFSSDGKRTEGRRGAAESWQQDARYSEFAHAAYSPAGSARPGGGSVRFQTAAASAPRSIFGGLARIAAGAGLVLAGIPMLILPGPGLLAILAGTALAAGGARKLFA